MLTHLTHPSAPDLRRSSLHVIWLIGNEYDAGQQLRAEECSYMP